jgi:signal transduction histidine kinase
LGLAIVIKNILAHDGAVEAESTTGDGTTIRLFLPVEAPGAVG